jgi:SagB-type dehydrogenase family enzyme
VSLSVLTETLAEAFVDVRERRLVTDPDTPLSLVTSSFGSAWDVYIVAYDVEGLQSGAYKYDVVTRRLEARRTDHPDIRSYMCDALQGQRPPATAGFTVILVADFPRYQWRYRHDRALRVLYLESGIVSQYVVLAAWARGLATLVTPAQKDSAVSDLLGLDSTVLSTITTLTVGWSRGRRGSLLEGIDTEDCPE